MHNVPCTRHFNTESTRAIVFNVFANFLLKHVCIFKRTLNVAIQLLENEKQSFNNFLECREHIQKRFIYVICCISTMEFILCFIIIASAADLSRRN